MASLHEKLEAEFEQMDYALHELPSDCQMNKLSVLELAGTASFLSSLYHGVENILKQGLHAKSVPLPSRAAWHRDLLQLACAEGIISTDLRDRLVPYMAFRHFFTHSYGFDLDPERLLPLIREIRPIYARFKKEAARFVRALVSEQRPDKQDRRTKPNA
jgi:hypothetical protein